MRPGGLSARIDVEQATSALTTDTSVGSNFTATRLMRVATIGGGSVCVLVGLLVAFLRTY